MKNLFLKVLACFCAVAMMFALAACNDKADKAADTEQVVEATAATTTADTEAVTSVKDTEEPVVTTTAPATEEITTTFTGTPTVYEGLEYEFEIDGHTAYAHHGTWEVVSTDGEDNGALHLIDGQGILLIHDLDYSKKVTISSKVKIDANVEPGNIGYAMCAWWDENASTNDNWAFFEGDHSGYFYCYLSGKRSAGLIGKYDCGVSKNGSTGWESFNAAKIGTYGIPEIDLFNAGELENVVWEQGKYYDFSCTWDAETLTLSTSLDGNPLYSVTFPEYPLSVEGDDFGLRSNIPGVYFKDITISVE